MSAESAGEPAQAVKVTILLADRGLAPPNMGPSLLNVGWNGTALLPNGVLPPATIAVFFSFPYSMLNRDVSMLLELLDDDGRRAEAVFGPGAPPQPVFFEQTLRVTGIPGSPNGSPGSGSTILEMPPTIVAKPGTWYKWRVAIEGSSRPEWETLFWVAPRPTHTRAFGQEAG